MYSPIYYIIQQLRDIRFSESEIESFLTLIYNASGKPTDIESQIAYSNNQRYIWAYSLLDEDIYGSIGQYYNEYINSVLVSENMTIDSESLTIDDITITIDS